MPSFSISINKAFRACIKPLLRYHLSYQYNIFILSFIHPTYHVAVIHILILPLLHIQGIRDYIRILFIHASLEMLSHGSTQTFLPLFSV